MTCYKSKQSSINFVYHLILRHKAAGQINVASFCVSKLNTMNVMLCAAKVKHKATHLLTSIWQDQALKL